MGHHSMHHSMKTAQPVVAMAGCQCHEGAAWELPWPLICCPPRPESDAVPTVYRLSNPPSAQVSVDRNKTVRGSSQRARHIGARRKRILMCILRQQE